MADYQSDVQRLIKKAVELGRFKSEKEALEQLIVNVLNPWLMSRRDTIVTIIPDGAVDKAIKNQNEWISFYNDRRALMFGAPDAYSIGKNGTDRDIADLQGVFNENWLIAGDRVDYHPNDLGGRITHNFGSMVTPPVIEELTVIPVYRSVPLPEVLRSEDGVRFQRALYATTDDPKTIMEVLEHLQRRKAENILNYTPDQASRQSLVGRAVWFYGYGRDFHVFAGFHLGINGRSRRVLREPAKRAPKK